MADLYSKVMKMRGATLGRDTINSRGLENPLPKWGEAWYQVKSLIQSRCKRLGITYTQLITSARQIYPELADAFLSLSEVLDSDLYGKWSDGTLTSDELSQFYRRLDQWVEITKHLTNLDLPGQEDTRVF